MRIAWLILQYPYKLCTSVEGEKPLEAQKTQIIILDLVHSELIK